MYFLHECFSKKKKKIIRCPTVYSDYIRERKRERGGMRWGKKIIASLLVRIIG